MIGHWSNSSLWLASSVNSDGSEAARGATGALT
mgnify:CR=1 FL=1